MTKLNIDIKDHKFRELLTYWRKVIGERLRRKQYYEDPRYGTIVLTRREFLKLLLSLGVAGALATLGIGMFNAHWVWAQETTNPPPTPTQYNYGELNWLELTVKGTPLGEGLVAEYLLWEGTGNIIHDTSGLNNHGTIYAGSPAVRWLWWKNGKPILYFPVKTNGYIIINKPVVDKDRNFSVEFLLYPIECAYNSNGVFEIFCTNGRIRIALFPDNWHMDDCEAMMYSVSSEISSCPTYPNETYFRYHWFSWNVDLGPKQWHHYIWTYDVEAQFDGKVWLFVDAGKTVKIGSSDWFKSNECAIKYWKNLSQTVKIQIGTGYYCARWWGYYGLIRIYQRLLQQLYINQLYNIAKIIFPELP